MESMVITTKQEETINVLSQLCAGVIDINEAARKLGLSVRQIKRKKKAYLERGIESTIHGNSGKKPKKAFSDELKESIVNLYLNEYYGWNYSHFRDELEDELKEKVSRSFIYALLTERVGPSPVAKKHKETSHPMRARREYAGELIQVDASKHQWLYGTDDYYYLHGAIDDSTGIVTACVLMDEETILGYQLLLKDTIERYGIPECLYTDYRTVFQSSKRLSLEEQIVGKEVKEPRYVKMLHRLGVDIISTTNPRAKGRIERLWRTFQDRLVKELAKKRITTKEEANRYINEVFLPKYNARFASRINCSKNKFVCVGDNFNYDLELAMSYIRKVLHNTYVMIEGKYYAICKGQEPQYIHSRQGEVLFLLNGEKKFRIGETYYDLVTFEKIKRPTMKKKKMEKSELYARRSEYGKRGAAASPWRNYLPRAKYTNE